MGPNSQAADTRIVREGATNDAPHVEFGAKVKWKKDRGLGACSLAALHFLALLHSPREEPLSLLPFDSVKQECLALNATIGLLSHLTTL